MPYCAHISLLVSVTNDHHCCSGGTFVLSLNLCFANFSYEIASLLMEDFLQTKSMTDNSKMYSSPFSRLTVKPDGFVAGEPKALNVSVSECNWATI